MTVTGPRRLWRAGGALLAIAALAGCSTLPRPQREPVSTYVLTAPATPGPQATTPGAPVLLVAGPTAGAALDTPRMAYVRRPYAIGYYLYSRWADAPSRMLRPLVTGALAASGRFGAVLQAPAVVPADLRLDLELLRFQQDFTVHPSRLELTLRAQLVDLHRQRVVATRVFRVTEPAPGDDAYGGVQAANRAVGALLPELTAFCTAAAGAAP